MTQYIDKAAVVAEIEKLIDDEFRCDSYDEATGFQKGLDLIKSFIDSLKAKEIDLEKEARHYLLHEHLSPLNSILHQADLKTELQYHKDIETAFKAGFELGLKAQKGE